MLIPVWMNACDKIYRYVVSMDIIDSKYGHCLIKSLQCVLHCLSIQTEKKSGESTDWKINNILYTATVKLITTDIRYMINK